MKGAILLLGLYIAVATAAHVPAAHKQDHAKWDDESTAKHDFNKGLHDKKSDGFKDNKSSHVQGGNNYHHREHYTATKHNVVKDKHVVNHNSDDKKAVVNHQAYGKGYGDSYKVGGNQKSRDSGKNGKVEHTVHQTNQHAGHSKQQPFGYYNGFGNYGINKASETKHNQYGNSFANYGDSASNKQGDHKNHVKGNKNNGDAYDRYVKHNEVHTHHDEDYVHKDVLQEANRHNKFQKADSAHADKGHSNSVYDHAHGHDNQWKASSGHKDSDSHSHGKGGHAGHKDSASKATGKRHQDHDSKKGGHHDSHDNVAKKEGGSYDKHSDNKNVYNIKTKKVHKVETIVNHSDGYSKDNFDDFKFDQGKYGFDSNWSKANKDAKKDNNYNNYNNQYTAQQYKPAAKQQHKPAATQQYKPAAQQYKPATQQYKPAAQQYKPAAQQYKPAAQHYQPATQHYQPAAPYQPAAAPAAPQYYQPAQYPRYYY